MKWIPDVPLLKDRRVIGLAGGCLIAGFLAGMLIFGSPWHLPPNWGDIPSWLLVLLAAVGGWFTLSQLSIQRRQLREQQDVLEREATDRRRAQASRVFIWLERHSDIRVGQAQVAAGAIRGEWINLHVKNSSDQPVYDAEVRWHLGSPANYLASTPLPVLMPGEDAEASRPVPQVDPGRLGATLRFRDANQVRWNRYPDGQLFEEE